jgi:hypothetical protein
LRNRSSATLGGHRETDSSAPETCRRQQDPAVGGVDFHPCAWSVPPCSIGAKLIDLGGGVIEQPEKDTKEVAGMLEVRAGELWEELAKLAQKLQSVGYLFPYNLFYIELIIHPLVHFQAANAQPEKKLQEEHAMLTHIGNDLKEFERVIKVMKKMVWMLISRRWHWRIRVLWILLQISKGSLIGYWMRVSTFFFVPFLC